MRLEKYVIIVKNPEDFIPACDRVEINYLNEDTYVSLTITEPQIDPFERMPK